MKYFVVTASVLAILALALAQDEAGPSSSLASHHHHPRPHQLVQDEQQQPGEENPAKEQVDNYWGDLGKHMLERLLNVNDGLKQEIIDEVLSYQNEQEQPGEENGFKKEVVNYWGDLGKHLLERVLQVSNVPNQEEEIDDGKKEKVLSHQSSSGK